MVGIATDYSYRATKIITNATEIGVQFCFYRWMYQRFAVLGAEYKVYIIFYK